MHNKYIKPETSIVTISSSPLMMTTSGETGGAGTGTGSAGDNTPDLSEGRRGQWGDLWYENV